MLVIVVFLPI